MEDVENKQKTKNELMSEMRHHQDQYATLKAQLQKMQQEENFEVQKKRQLGRLEEFKAKYKFYVAKEAAEQAIPIDWDEVQKLIELSFGNEEGYALGWDATGMPGLGYSGPYDNSINQFSPMIEDDTDSRKYHEREAKRKEIELRRKNEPK